tara:strand:- start:737 stop:1060 length:324 start_codon:yes stop_codon:yes gene_type:complete
MSKLNSNDVERIVNDIIKSKPYYRNKTMGQFEADMKEKYPEFNESHPEIFKSVLSGSLDMNMFKYMISMLKKMERGNITERNASIEVGQVLVDKYVKPLVDDNKKNN